LGSFHQRLLVVLRLLDQKYVGYEKIKDANPPFYQRMFGALTLMQAGKGQREIG